MFTTPPPAPPRANSTTTVKTRAARARELMNIPAQADSVVVRKLDPKSEQKELLDLPKAQSSLKIELAAGGMSPARSGKSSGRSSITARRKLLELEAAEARAAIDKELIDKRLAAELAALDDGAASSSRRSRVSGTVAANARRVVQWMDKSDQELLNRPEGATSVANVPPLPPSPTPAPLPPPSAPIQQPPPAIVPPAPSHTMPYDVYHITRAMENLATATHNSNAQLLSRLATPKDLPPFFGEPLEWLQFKKYYHESNKLCRYSDSENIARLSKCLRGEAKEAVSSLLISDTTPSIILEALELRFGRPELIIHKIASQFKKLPPLPQTYHTEIVNFAVKVKNYVAAAQSINQTDYIRSPELLNTVLSKCPSALMSKWVDYIYLNDDGYKAKLQIFSEFINKEATKIAAAGISYITSQSDHKTYNYKRPDERRTQVHAVLNNDAGSSEKCKLCRATPHPITSCTKFKRALRKDRWRIVKMSRLCHKCLLPGHSKEACPAASCDVDECGLPHHRMLHWPARTKNDSSAPHTQSAVNITTSETDLTSANEANSSETVTNTTYVSPGGSVMLKIVRVNIHGPKGVISTYALLDDGATVSLLSADLADSVNITGQSETLRIRGAWNSEIVCHSEVVKFKLSNNNNNQLFEIRARKISELDLPVQNLSKVNIDSYEHLRDIKNYLCCNNVKPKILIGQDNFQLLVSLKTVYRGKNEPCATLTPLGWCLHGIVPALQTRSRPTTTALALTTTLYEDAPDSPTYLPLSAAAAAAAHRDAETRSGPGALKTYSTQNCGDVHENNIGCIELHELVQRSFAFDSIGVTLKPRQKEDDIRAIEIIEKSARLVNGRWEIGLPWRGDLRMPDSYANALKRFLGVERKMSLNENFATRYRERINHLFENDYARPLSDDEITSTKINREWYIPHFGVDNPNKKKLRLVFDAAATTAGTSLNDYLLQGPDLLQPLFGIMLRFREKPVAYVGDIKDMFLRIKIEKGDQHALRFLWRENPKSTIKIYAMTSLIFGANCSPFIAQHIKNKNALQFISEMPEAVESVLRSHYMDDYIESMDDEESAAKLIHEVSEIHRRGGFQIRNWACNKTKVLESMPKETLSDQATKINISHDDSPERTLGLLWFPSSDALGFDLSLKRIAPEITDFKRKPTKRELLRIVMSIFDIFGFLAPVTVRAKILLRSTWKSGLKWDDEIEDKDYLIFKDWLKTLKKLETLRIPRWFFKTLPNDDKSDRDERETLELHIFCDASPVAYTATAYWRKIKPNTICVSFIACKCRASPISKYTTIPRLELQSAVVGCRLAETIIKESRIKPESRFLWTDSMIVFHQIKNESRNYKVFVANRLGEIDELSQHNEWHYIDTKRNIADKATKLNTYELTDDCEWLQGPDFLYTPRESWPKYAPEKEKIQDEILQVNTINKIEIDLPVVPDPTRFSSWLRLKRCMGYVFLFINRCRKRCPVELTTEIMQRAEIEILRYAQMQSFQNEIHLLKQKQPIEVNSKLRTLTPYLDENGLLRVDGRINAAPDVNFELKNPVILDGRQPIAKLIVKYYHEKNAHGNNERVINEMRQRYWLLRMRPTVRTVASSCMTCRVKKARPAAPRMGDLPEARLAHHRRPYTYCGVDLFGPMDVAVGRRREKRYGVLFTCLTVRAIHVEIVPTLSADSFIMALRRMAARRGWPYRMYSDNGTNFRGAHAELTRSLQEISHHTTIKDDLVNNGLEWHFIPPGSPHMGGAWERLIRSVKTALNTVLKERAPRDEILSTLLTEVENMVNSRPLTHVSVNPDDPESLTPNHFLIGSSSNLPVPGVFDDGDIYGRRMWRTAQRLADMFWKRWVKEVLPTLLPRSKWFQDGNNLKKGDVVVIVDSNLPRNTWPKGVIERVHPGADGRVRAADVKTKTGILTRPTTRLAVLPLAEQSN